MKLLQYKLDVTEKSRSNIFNWRGQFTPQFIDYILDNLASPNFTVIDPFSGSGTVLQECAAKRMSCHGMEINPAAYAMSKFFTFANNEEIERLQLISSLQSKVHQLTKSFENLPLFKSSIDFRESFKNLLDFSDLLYSKISDKQERILALITLFEAEKRQNNGLVEAIIKSFEYIRQCLLNLPYSEKKITAHLSDARATHKLCHAKADLILTSPPYINVFNYHQNHRAILEKLGWNLLKVAISEIGANRKNRGNRFKTVTQYCLDMSKALESFWYALKPNGILVLVIGRESKIRGIPFYNTLIIKDLIRYLDGYGSFTNYERNFINRYGINIKEDIILTRKSTRILSNSRARDVALKHLTSALNFAPPQMREDINDAIANIDTIVESPIFSVDEAKQNA